jgi:hypothetical protein
VALKIVDLALHASPPKFVANVASHESFHQGAEGIGGYTDTDEDENDRKPLLPSPERVYFPKSDSGNGDYSLEHRVEQGIAESHEAGAANNQHPYETYHPVSQSCRRQDGAVPVAPTGRLAECGSVCVVLS